MPGAPTTTPRSFPVLCLLLLGCGAVPPRAGPEPPPASSTIEQAYQDLRYWTDQLQLAEYRGADRSPDGHSLPVMRDRAAAAHDRLASLLDAAVARGATGSDRPAVAAIRAAWAGGLGAAALQDADSDHTGRLRCGYRADSIAALDRGLERLTRVMVGCYGAAASDIVLDGRRLDRLAILGLLPRTGDPDRRRRLFLALDPVWRSVNAGDEPGSPYRTLLRLRLATWGDSGSPLERKAPAFGLTTQELEGWLVQALEVWRAAMPDTLLEPWDWYYASGAASRRLSPLLPAVADIRRANDRYYSAIGAAPGRLGIHFDLEPRPGKYPVSLTTPGVRNRWIDGRFVPGEPWVVTSYIEGGFDNLAELLHETGHAIHLAALRSRPAFIDWPDNDTFTEALADVPALEAYEPGWQIRYLGDSVGLAESIRAKYAGVVMDMTWALFEIRVYRTPGVDPNRLWSELTGRYLRIRPHPEWSWWAMRGQLIDGPGYLINYALGAFMAADIRASARWQRGSFTAADTTLYPWLAGRLYRFGLERPSRMVLEEMLGRPLGREALLKDMERLLRTAAR